MSSQGNAATRQRPVPSSAVLAEAQASFDDLVAFCQTCDSVFGLFEKEFAVRLALLACRLIRLFLTARHEHTDLQPFLKSGVYRRNDAYGQRTLKTRYGRVRYGRQYLQAVAGGPGVFPLDVTLGLTNDRLSPWMLQWVARLATRMSFQAARRICRAVLSWAPATETIEQVVLGLGRDAGPFMTQRERPEGDGEMLVIETDGKCPPTATAAELAKRRGKRKPQPPMECATCRPRCQRHRGRAKRDARGSKVRRPRGCKSKNGKEVIVVVMYTLKRGVDGMMHGPLNKKVYATFAGRKAAALWARAEATKRGFGPDTSKTVQIVLDGSVGLKARFAEQFPTALFTLDVCHVTEKLWALGRHFHKEGSAALKSWVEPLKDLLYGGQAEALVQRLEGWLHQVSKHGPGTAGRRQALATVIRYVERRVSMMQYGEWIEKDYVIASGQVEGAVRHVVGERFDCAGMRWVRGKAEALLHLRCIELNGDWDNFVAWHQEQVAARLRTKGRVKLLHDKGLNVRKVA